MHAAVPEQALEPLMRCRFPAVGTATPIRVDARRLDPNEQLPTLTGVAEFGDGPGRLKNCAVLRQADEQLGRNLGSAGGARDVPCVPAQNGLRERPGIRENRKRLANSPSRPLRGIGAYVST